MSMGNPPPQKSPWDRLSAGQKVIASAALAAAFIAVFGLIGALAPPETDEADQTTDTSTTSATTPDTPPATPTPSEPADEARECEQYEDPTSGDPLCDYVDSASYNYRLRLAQNLDTTLGDVLLIAPWTEQQNLTDLYGTCDDIARGLPAGDVTDNAILRFSGGSDEQLDAAGADQLVAIARRDVCPDA